MNNFISMYISQRKLLHMLPEYMEEEVYSHAAEQKPGNNTMYIRRKL